MTSFAQGNPTLSSAQNQRKTTKNRKMSSQRGTDATDSDDICEVSKKKSRTSIRSNQSGMHATDTATVYEEPEPTIRKSALPSRTRKRCRDFETTITVPVHCDGNAYSSAIPGRTVTVEVRSQSQKREIEIREHVFSISLPGVEITHCNFGKTRVEVWYVSEKTADIVEEKLQDKIEQYVEPYKLKLVKKAGLPVFKYTSPGQAISLRRPGAGSIGAYVTLKDKDNESKLHGLVSGHGKAPGDKLYFNHNPVMPIGEVKVAKVATRERCVADGDVEHQHTNSIDVGLVLMHEQQLDRHETSVTTNEFGRIQLARAEAAIHPVDIDDDQKVMLFSSDNKQGAVRYLNYNSRNPQKFGMIGISQNSEEMQAVHGMNESGTLVAAWPPYQENGVKRVKAVGMLVGIEEFEPSPEIISLAVPIGTNLQELIEDEYCAHKELQFA